MITDFLWPQLDEMDLDGMFFQQDGATCHTTAPTIDLLKQKFPETLISLDARDPRRIQQLRPDAWPPRSCDLTPLDYFLWGYVKSLVYANKPQSIEDLKRNIEHTIREINADILHRVTENWVHRIRSCKRSRGGNLNDVLFRT